MKKRSNWGWLVGIIVIIALSSMLAHKVRAGEESAVDAFMRSVAKSDMGRRGVCDKVPDWKRPFEVGPFSLAMSRDETAKYMTPASSWRKTMEGDVEVWRRVDFPEESVAFDAAGRVVRITYGYLAQDGGQIIDIPHLGRPDRLLRDRDGDVATWNSHPEVGIIQYRAANQQFILSRN